MVSRIFNFFRQSDMDPDCVDVRESSSDLIDGDLDESLVARINEHLGGCGPCRSFIQTMRATVGLLRSIPVQKAPPDFAEKLKKRIDEG